MLLGITVIAQQTSVYKDTTVIVNKLNSQNRLDEYIENIDIADIYFKEYKFDSAIKHYNKALSITPNDAYAKGKINRIKDIQTSLNTNSSEFNKLITDGITLLNNKQFTEANKIFKKIRKILPDNEEVKVLIEKVKIAEADYYSNQEIFNKEVDIAYNYLTDSNYVDAIKHLNIAQEIEPNNWAVANEIKTYNVLAINQINLQLDTPKKNINTTVSTPTTYTKVNSITVNEIKNLNIQINPSNNNELLISEIGSSIEQKQNEINDINKKLEEEIEKQTRPLIILGDSLLKLGAIEQAITPYLKAFALNPNDTLTQNKITKINEIETNIAIAAKRKYNTTITNADRLYKMKSYDKAINTYRNASDILPDEKYPKEMESNIINMMENNIVTYISKDKTSIYSNTTEVFEFEPINVNIRRNNYIFIKARNINGNSFKVIVSYGINNSKNGGFVIQIPEGKMNTEYIIRVGNQYKWFADENNWISIHPEKGDIEIDLIRISKSE